MPHASVLTHTVHACACARASPEGLRPLQFQLQSHFIHLMFFFLFGGDHFSLMLACLDLELGLHPTHTHTHTISVWHLSLNEVCEARSVAGTCKAVSRLLVSRSRPLVASSSSSSLSCACFMVAIWPSAAPISRSPRFTSSCRRRT